MGIRCFVAVELEEAIKRQLLALQEKLADIPAKVRWVTREQMHITVKFLGDTREETVTPLAEALAEAVAGYPPFEVEVAGTGCFPPSGWLGRLASDVDGAAARLGFAREGRSFRAHLTLGRVRWSEAPAAARGRVAAYGDFRGGRQSVAGISLMRSDLRPSGAVYTRLARVGFGGGGCGRTANGNRTQKESEDE
jgi:2'-5' RNA ligase